MPRASCQSYISVGLKPVIQIPREPPESTGSAEIHRKETKTRNPGGIQDGGSENCPYYRPAIEAISVRITYEVLVFLRVTLHFLIERDLLINLVYSMSKLVQY